MSVAGLDFGDLSCVACAARRGGIDTVLNENSKRKTTSAVSFQGSQRFIGEAAVPLARSNYKNTVHEIKRFLGASWNDPEVQAMIATLPNKDFFVETEGNKVGVKVSYNDEKMVLSPEELTAMLLGGMSNTIASWAGQRSVADLVLSVPHFFTDKQRRALLDAAKIAKLNVLSLINDNTATALAGIWKSARNMFHATDKQHVMFVDMGHSQFTVSIVAFVQGKLQVVATACDRTLGGRAIDGALVDKFAQEFSEKHKADPRTNPKALIKLTKACAKAKTTLTPEGVAFANVNVEFLMNDTDFRSKVLIEDFEEMCAPLVARIAGPIEKALAQSGLTAEDLHAVEIVGGSTRVRCIKREIARVLKLDTSKTNYGLSTTLNADECVAKGCALYCAMLSPAFRVKEFAVGDINALPIRVSWTQDPVPADDGDAAMEDDAGEDQGENASSASSLVLFKSGAELPKTRRITFRRSKPFTISAEYDAEAAGALPPGTDPFIGEFTVSGMSAQEDDVPPTIRVNFRLDSSGVFSASSSQMLVEIKPKEEEKVAEEAKKEDENAAAPAAEEGEAKKEDAGDAKAEEGDKKEEEAKKEGESKSAEGKDDAAEKPRPKKRYKRSDLDIKSVVRSMSSVQLEKSIERELAFVNQDRIIRETADARNALEEFVYGMRSSITGRLSKYATPETVETVTKKLDTTETWLYDEGFDQDKQVYEEKLRNLKEMVEKVEFRYNEVEKRPKAASELAASIESMLAIVNSTEEQYAHLTDEERETVRTECAKAQSWLEAKRDEQDKLDKSADPVLTSSMIASKKLDAEMACRPVLTKPKPKPAPAPAPEAPAPESGDAKMEEDPSPEAKAQDEGEGDAPADMEVDGEGAEAKEGDEKSAAMDLD